jgi:glutaredoxin
MKGILDRLLRSRRRLKGLTFAVYTREGCGCCDKALTLLRDRQRRHGFQIHEVDIDTDPLLVARYNTEVPVVALNGNVRFKGVVNPVLLDRLLVSESRRGKIGKP